MTLPATPLALTAAIGIMVGAFLHGILVRRRARHNLRCDVCHSRTTADGVGAREALGDNWENWAYDDE